MHAPAEVLPNQALIALSCLLGKISQLQAQPKKTICGQNKHVGINLCMPVGLELPTSLSEVNFEKAGARKKRLHVQLLHHVVVLANPCVASPLGQDWQRS